MRIGDKPLRRLKKKTTTENLWIYILRLLKEKPMYAYELNKNIQERFDFKIGTVSAYVILYKLLNEGYVDTEWREEERQRKYYTITEKGVKLLDEGISYINEMREKLE
ncbi:MAG: PadR family transcriptional regulator [Candidatus Altiarchaeota archaeon]|nr:PadR family transcriptional regulator [Candidatus Altiarchaeota archaeon]